jgi:hypothetical protein
MLDQTEHDTTTAPAWTPLDEAREFIGRFIDASPTQLDVMTTWAAHTHVLRAFVTTPRLLFTSKEAESGKSEALQRVIDLSANGWGVSKETTKDAIRSKLDCPPESKPTVSIDEVSDIFGQNGHARSPHPIASYLRLGYKVGANASMSRSGVAVDIDVFLAAAMAGLGNAVPKDIRTRAIWIFMRVGWPQEDYLVREHVPQAEMLREALANFFGKHIPELEAFRARGIHPKLTGRKREIWEPLFAVAHVAGGSWPRRILAAFLDLVMDEGEHVILTPKQTVLRDMQTAAETLGLARVGGSALLGILRTCRTPMYEPMPDRSLAMLMAAAMEPVRPTQFRDAETGRPVRGYTLADIRRIAAERLPAPPEMAEPEEPEDAGVTIFDVPAGDGALEGNDLAGVVTGVEPPASGVTTVTAGATSPGKAAA